MKKKFLIIIVIISVCIAMLLFIHKAIPAGIVRNQTCNIYEGQINDSPIRMMICRNGIKLDAYYVMNGEEQPEHILTGKYNPVMQTVRLYEESLDMQLKGNTYGDTENNDLTVLKGITKSSLSDGTFYLKPVWRFSGCDRNNLYPDIGYDTKETEEFTDNIIKLIRENDSRGVSQFVSYPLAVSINNEHMMINSEEEFCLQFDDIMTQEYKESVVQGFRRYLWGNYMGINFGGEKSFWFNKRAEDETFKITAISNCDEDYNYDLPPEEGSGIEKG